ncbi:deferrochelatase/peroxidase EfeB, partial [Streptomyces sp. SID10244]|nr:deferrochelatase/peroxidase EfeB [Streptomyces sp. SID10244]
MSENTPPPAENSRRQRISRRALLGGAGVGVVAAAAGGAIGRATAAEETSGSQVVAFRGERQAGIITAAQDRLHFVSFDVITDSRSDLVAMLQKWTVA